MHMEATAGALAVSGVVKQVCSTVYVVRATLAEFGLQPGNAKVNIQNEE
jgi:hypothetical protein